MNRKAILKYVRSLIRPTQFEAVCAIVLISGLCAYVILSNIINSSVLVGHFSIFLFWALLGLAIIGVIGFVRQILHEERYLMREVSERSQYSSLSIVRAALLTFLLRFGAFTALIYVSMAFFWYVVPEFVVLINGLSSVPALLSALHFFYALIIIFVFFHIYVVLGRIFMIKVRLNSQMMLVLKHK